MAPNLKGLNSSEQTLEPASKAGMMMKPTERNLGSQEGSQMDRMSKQCYKSVTDNNYL